MCGIAGIITIKNSKIDSTVVENVKRSLEHRGPDHSSHQFIKESVCLIHTRLSIIDLNDRSNQPFQSNDERYTIVFNGEIYNFLELKDELEKKGCVFTTKSDTEVLLYGLITEGIDFQLKCNGMWAFCLCGSGSSTPFLWAAGAPRRVTSMPKWQANPPLHRHFTNTDCTARHSH